MGQLQMSPDGWRCGVAGEGEVKAVQWVVQSGASEEGDVNNTKHERQEREVDRRITHKDSYDQQTSDWRREKSWVKG